MGKRLTVSMVLFASLLLIGSGCVEVEVENQNPADAAAAIQLATGSEMVLRETVFGISGPFIKFFKQEDAARTLKFQEYQSDKQVKIKWSVQREIQTENSQKEIEAYKLEYENAPVGTTLPEAPKPTYEVMTETGTLFSSSFADSTKIYLPLFWKTNEQGGEGTSLLWLSTKQYDELTQTRKTQINIGLFDDSASYAVGLTDQLKHILEKIKGSNTPAEEKSLFDIEADIDWTTYTLTVNGELMEVQAIRAQNAFARYSILANRENPLILELMLSPASRGSLSLFNREAIGKAFWGYEVVSISHATE